MTREFREHMQYAVGYPVGYPVGSGQWQWAVGSGQWAVGRTTAGLRFDAWFGV